MADKQKIYIKVCKRCKHEFESDVPQRQICRSCRREEKFAGCNKPTRSRNGVFESLSVMEITRLINRYNRERGMCLSYGKFVLAVRNGRITEKDLRVVK